MSKDMQPFVYANKLVESYASLMGLSALNNVELEAVKKIVSKTLDLIISASPQNCPVKELSGKDCSNFFVETKYELLNLKR
jgi:hypothetical protein